MIKKGALLFMLAALLFIISGCETIKGAFQGGAAGAKKDWQVAQQIDGWIRKNLW